MTGQRGFVLVNALILVAALAAAAVVVMARAEAGRARLQASQGADQLGAYLDAFEAQALHLIMRDDGAVDHPGDAWARAQGVPVDLDRGRVAGNIVDVQGLFNLNWLANPEDAAARAAFDRLLRAIGARPSLAADVIALLEPGTPGNGAAYAALDPGLDPVTGPLLFMRQLEGVPTLSDRDRAVLEPVAALAPGDSWLNLNTAAPRVVAAFFPGLSTEQMAALLSPRDTAPFQSGEAFLKAVETARGAALPEDFDRGRFSVGSVNFEVTATATLEGRHATRTVGITRTGLGQRPRIRWRETTRDAVRH